MGTPPELLAPLLEYADRLLLGTGLDAAEALLITSRGLDPPAQPSGLAHALRSRWSSRGLPMSVALFDLGQRLRAATLGRPVASSAFAPVLPPTDPAAVTVIGAGEHALVRAADGLRATAAGGPVAVSALGELDIALRPSRAPGSSPTVRP
jgi:hypothetical protein